jgi:UDP-N-acetylglucosamine acyltransferase
MNTSTLLTAKAGCTIHPTALVAQGAELGSDVVIGPYCVVGPQVQLGDGVELHAHVVVSGRTQIGARTRVWPFATLGSTPQDLKYRNEDAQLLIGSDNMIREYVNISLGTTGGGGITRIGNGNLLMVHVHVAHDCLIGDTCIFANGVSLGGHIEVDSSAVFGGHVAVHQYVRIGSLAMLAGGAIVVQDVPPYCMVHGNHAEANGLNVVGLRRSGMPAAEVSALKACYRLIFNAKLTLADAIKEIRASVDPVPSREKMLAFLEGSIADPKKQRGLCR